VPTKIIRFRDNPVVYRIGDDAPWFVIFMTSVTTGDISRYMPVGELGAGMRIRGAGTSIEGRAEILTVESIEVEEDNLPLDEPPERPSRILVIGDEIGNASFGGMVTSSIDFDASFVTFSCGTRLSFSVITNQFSFMDGSDIALPVNLRQAVPLRAEAHRIITVYHIEQPGWYELPLLGTFNLSHEAPDTYISLGPEGLTSHEGPLFRAMFDITTEGTDAPRTSRRETEPPSLRERLLDE